VRPEEGDDVSSDDVSKKIWVTWCKLFSNPYIFTTIMDIDRWMAANRLRLNADKTELLWIGSKRNLSMMGDSGTTTVTVTDHARGLWIIISSDLSLERHVSHVCSKSFFHLRQLRRVRSSLDSNSASTLVHAFVTTRVDYCNAILAGATKATTRQTSACIECCCSSSKPHP